MDRKRRANRLVRAQKLMREAAALLEATVQEDRRVYAAVNRGSMEARDRVGVVRLYQADELEKYATEIEGMIECGIGKNKSKSSSKLSHTQEEAA